MRAVKMLFTGSLATLAVAVFACGGSSQVLSAPTDAGGSDVTQPVVDSSSACTIDADLVTAAPPDAALNDAGASVGTCIGCARAACAPEIVNCNSDCSCNNVFDCLFNCLGTVGGTLIYCYTGACGGQLPVGNTTNLDQPEVKLLECAAKSCAAQCDACSVFAGLCPATDAGTQSGDDAESPTDGAADAPSDATGE